MHAFASNLVPGPLSQPSLSEQRRPGLLRLAFGLAFLWCVGLAVLALTTANPPQINLAQFALARDVVQVRVDDPDEGRCTVVRRWTPGVPQSEIRVTNLHETSARRGREYILPLSPAVGSDGAYRIASDPRRGDVPYIYTAGELMDRQLQAWFDGGRESGAAADSGERPPRVLLSAK
jgi:hypothetical protein